MKQRINFIDFELTKSLLPTKFHYLFKPSLFLHFMPDPDGRISILEFYNYVHRRVSLLQARLDFSAYDTDRDGFLTEEDLEHFIADLIPSLHLRNLSKTISVYICTAVRKFMFFLDPLRRGKITIQTILLSPILSELFELRYQDPRHHDRNNWFSAHSHLRIYGQFLNLDADQNGMLSRSDLGKYGGGTLTDPFLDRVFQECQTYNGEMDYKSFLDFVLAMENVQTPESMAYCFRLLDMKGVGYLDYFTIGFFLKVQ
ncbi:Serine/threonine-protein phosphatase 2A regulatory subunit B'' subunit gamma [Borealophlyctis nickersoniae]|nr:Serine/threonine-protein phosphatase 2A regulatory subunit B'' subunit gamma [Borealophlyctis nickersoniae]